MKVKIFSVLLLMASNSLADIVPAKLTGIDNYGNPCWVNISEAKNEKEPLLASHQIKVSFNYSPDTYTLTHPVEQVNLVFQPAPLVYSGRSVKPNRTDNTNIDAAKALVSLTIDKNHNPVSFGYWDNDGGDKEFKRRNFLCKLDK